MARPDRAYRTARWYITAADRDQSNTFIQLVEFPDREAAAANSGHPATSQFAAELRAVCIQNLTFRNLDVVTASTLS